MTKRNSHIIQAPSLPTVLIVEFLNGRTMQVPINPVEPKMAVAPDGTMYSEVRARVTVNVPMAPMGLTIIPPGVHWPSPDKIAIVANIDISPTETDLIVRHVDGSSETIRLQHPPGAKVVMQQPAADAPRDDLNGVVG